MRAELYNTRLCASDFEKYDVPNLKDTNEPFFWLVYDNGTCLQFIGQIEISSWASSERMRLALFRSHTVPIDSLRYYSGRDCCKFFYWDGAHLLPLRGFDELQEIFVNLFENFICKLERTHPIEKACCFDPLKVEFASPECFEQWCKSEEYAESMVDPSLGECLDRLTHHTRHAVDHKIVISRDYGQHNYNFAEVVNGKCRLNGGIILHDNASENRWQTHT